MTQNDLNQIRTVFKEEIQQEVKKVVEGVLEEKLEQKLEEKLEQKLKPIHKKLDKLQKDLGATNNYFDDLAIKHEKRLDRIENHLHLPVSTL